MSAKPFLRNCSFRPATFFSCTLYSSASEATALWRYRSFIIIIIIPRTPLDTSYPLCSSVSNVMREALPSACSMMPAPMFLTQNANSDQPASIDKKIKAKSAHEYVNI